MKAKDIMEALNGIDDDLLMGAEEKQKTKGFHLPKWAAAAACLIIAAGAAAVILPGVMGKDGPQQEAERLRNDVRIVSDSENAVIWPWEWMTLPEQAAAVNFEGAQYRTRTRTVGSALLGERLGVCESEGYDVYTETVHHESYAVYGIKGVDSECCIAVDLDGSYVVYFRGDMEPPKDLGAFMDACSLPDTLPLDCFCRKEAAQPESSDWYRTDASDAIWKLLSGCRAAPCRIDDGVNDMLRKGISFLAASEALGTSNKVFTVDKNGFLATNLLEYGCVFNIGTEAAEEIIRLAEKDCEKAAVPALNSWVAGTLKEIGDGYVLIDDSVLCRNAADGITYRVLTADLRIRRCLEYLGGFKPGDLVVVEYDGGCDAENTVTGAFSLKKGYLETDGAVSVQE